jgi:hypothetical protein
VFPAHTLVAAVGFPHRLRGPIDGLSVFTVHPTQVRDHFSYPCWLWQSDWRG